MSDGKEQTIAQWLAAGLTWFRPEHLAGMHDLARKMLTERKAAIEAELEGLEGLDEGAGTGERRPRRESRRPRPTARPSATSAEAGAPRGKKVVGGLLSRVIPGLTSAQVAERVGVLVQEHPGIDANELARMLSTNRLTLRGSINRAIAMGLVRREGQKRFARYFPAARR